MIKVILIIIIILSFQSCSSPLHKGIVKVEDLEKSVDTQEKLKLVKETNLEIEKHNPKIKEQVKQLKVKLINQIKSKVQKKAQDRRRGKLDKENKLSRLTNLKELGVIDITTRLSTKRSKRNNLSKDKYYVIRNNPNQDKFGGKLVCNEEVLILRLDRSKLIQCMEEERSKLPFNWKNFLVNYKFINIVNFKNHKVYPQCKLIHAVSLSAYHNLAICLINDKRLHGLFKYRNINSFGVNFQLIKEN